MEGRTILKRKFDEGEMSLHVYCIDVHIIYISQEILKIILLSNDYNSIAPGSVTLRVVLLKETRKN